MFRSLELLLARLYPGAATLPLVVSQKGLSLPLAMDRALG